MLGSEILNQGYLPSTKKFTLKNKLKKAEQQKKTNRKVKETEKSSEDASLLLQGLKIFSLIESDGFFVLYDLFDNSPVLILPILDSCLALDPSHHE